MEIENPMVMAEPYAASHVCDCGHEVYQGDTVLKWDEETFCELACLVDYIKLQAEEVEI